MFFLFFSAFGRVLVPKWKLLFRRLLGFIGFAVGRTTFWDPIVAYRDGKATREQAAEQIAENYIAWVNVFKGAQAQK